MLGVLEFDVSRASFPQIDLAYDQGKSYNPISELMRAIILRAIEDWQYGGELAEAAYAFFEDDEEDYIFSFSSCCRHLGLDPEAAKYAILNANRRISTRRRAA